MTVESLLAELEPVEDAQVAPGVGTYRYYGHITDTKVYRGMVACCIAEVGAYWPGTAKRLIRIIFVFVFSELIINLSSSSSFN